MNCVIHLSAWLSIVIKTICVKGRVASSFTADFVVGDFFLDFTVTVAGFFAICFCSYFH